MAIVQISRIQHRRGLQQDLPSLSSAELGWSVDTRKLYIGNGALAEGAPLEGRTEILTEFSILDFTNGFASNVNIIEADLANIHADVTTLESNVAQLQEVTLNANTSILIGPGSGNWLVVEGNNASIHYSLTQDTVLRQGTIHVTHQGMTVLYDDEYTETATTDITFSANANVTHANINYTTTTTTVVSYRLTTL